MHIVKDLILASASPRRKELLRRAGLCFRVIPSHISERLTGDVNPSTGSIITARLKADEIACKFPESWVIGADTIVCLANEILGKPETEPDAISMLRRLSNKTHEVITGFCVLKLSEEKIHSEAVSSLVTFKELTEDEIIGYVKTREPFGKAGAYAIQGIGSFMVKRTEGSYTNIVGLPVFEVIRALRELGAIKLFGAVR